MSRVALNNTYIMKESGALNINVAVLNKTHVDGNMNKIVCSIEDETHWPVNKLDQNAHSWSEHNAALNTNYCCWLLEFYILATSTITSGQVPFCDSAHSW